MTPENKQILQEVLSTLPPPFVLGAVLFLGINFIAYRLMRFDKKAALQSHRRVPEKALLFWAFFGGALGMRTAQFRFRHKTKKQPFKTLLYLCVIVNVCGWAMLFIFLIARLFE